MTTKQHALIEKHMKDICDMADGIRNLNDRLNTETTDFKDILLQDIRDGLEFINTTLGKIIEIL